MIESVIRQRHALLPALGLMLLLSAETPVRVAAQEPAQPSGQRANALPPKFTDKKAAHTHVIPPTPAQAVTPPAAVSSTADVSPTGLDVPVDPLMDFLGIDAGPAGTPPPMPIDLENATWLSIPFERLGFNDSVRRYNTQSIFGAWFYARGNQVLTEARIPIELATETLIPDEIRLLEFAVNGAVLARYDSASLREGPRARVLTVPPTALQVKNLFTMRIYTFDSGPCQDVLSAGTWRIIAKGAIEKRSAPLPVPNDLSMLPLPFYDPTADTDPLIHVAILDPVSGDTFKAAAMAASFFGMKAGSRLRFRVHLGAIPADDSAVVIATSGALRAFPMLTAAKTPAIQVVDHPEHPGGNMKLLILSGETAADVANAATWLVTHVESEQALIGQEIAVKELKLAASVKPYSAPLWLKTDVTSFGQIPGGKDLIHRGHVGGMLNLDFRIPPDLFTWPRDEILAKIRWTQLLPAGYAAAKIDVELNDEFLMTLPKLTGTGTAEPHMTILHMPRKRLRGWNRLIFHISALAQDPLCTSDSERFIQTRILPESELDLSGAQNVAQMPDVQSFIDDGFPFTRVHDLSESALVLPARPAEEEIASALSVIAHFSSVTGAPGTKLTIIVGPVSEKLVAHKEILMVGAAGNLPSLGAETPDTPVQYTRTTSTVRPPGVWGWITSLLSGRLPLEGASGADEAVIGAGAGAVMGSRSPFGHGRSVVTITAPVASALPEIVDMQGHADSHAERGDLLVVNGGHRALFNVGSHFMVGSMKGLTLVRWVAYRYWTLLLPLLLLMGVIMAFVFQRRLASRERARLDVSRLL